MPGWRDYRGQSVGLARIMSENPYSDGTTALLIENWALDEQDYLESTYRIMPLIPDEWKSSPSQPGPFTTSENIGSDLQSGVIGLQYAEFDNAPEILFLTYSGVFRFTPWARNSSSVDKGITEQYRYGVNTAKSSVKPQGKIQYPPQMVSMNNRIYFTFCDGGQAYVWDRIKIRPFGLTMTPSAPNADGPRDTTSVINGGGFTARGRIGTTISELFHNGTDGASQGAIDDGEYAYAVAYENADGAYSATSPLGGHVTISFKRADPEDLKKTMHLFKVKEIPVGTDEVKARILLRTRNLKRLPSGDDGNVRFLHRIPNNVATEYIDNVPDGELGPAWQSREPMPTGFYFLAPHGGSLWMMRTDANPSRIWWSEQSISGPMPESIMQSHWTDLFPDTGAITGVVSATLGSVGPALLVFKKSAVHYISGQYDQWQYGTLHHMAGCAGPSLAQVLPDSSVLWYGNGTFWLFGPNGVVQDVGGNIRKRLQRINNVAAHMGHSWVDMEHREAVFILPFDDSNVPNVQFVWDYIEQGFRLQTGFNVTGGSTYLPDSNTVLVAGTYQSGTGSFAKDLKSVFALNRQFPAINNPRNDRTSTYKSGWMSFGQGPRRTATFRAAQLVLTSEEKSSGSVNIKMFQDWNLDADTSPVVTNALHPESSTSIATYGSATYGTDVWRSYRTYTEKVSVDLPSESHHSIHIETTAPYSLYNVDVWGPKMAGSGGRNPTNDD